MAFGGEVAHHLLERDLDFLVKAVADKRNDHEEVKEIICDKEDLIELMLDDPKLLSKLEEQQDEILLISPYLLFSILLRHVRRELKGRTHTLELIGRERVAVFDVNRLNDLLDNSKIINYLAELLASFTRVERGFLVFRMGGKIKAIPFNALDLENLLFIAEFLPKGECYPLYHRIGDLCLFTVGILPDHVRKEKTGRQAKEGLGLEEYTRLGIHYYKKAAQHPAARRFDEEGFLERVADNFQLLTKPLNILSEKYIGLKRSQWFAL